VGEEAQPAAVIPSEPLKDPVAEAEELLKQGDKNLQS